MSAEPNISYLTLPILKHSIRSIFKLEVNYNKGGKEGRYLTLPYFINIPYLTLLALIRYFVKYLYFTNLKYRTCSCVRYERVHISKRCSLPYGP